jgi:exonuclease III
MKRGKAVKTLIWNICLGENPAKEAGLSEYNKAGKSRGELIVNTIINYNPEAALLMEYQADNSANGLIIKENLEKAGYDCKYHQSTNYLSDYFCYVLSAVKRGYEHSFELQNPLLREKYLELRWVEMNLIKEDLSILGVHVPAHAKKYDRKPYFWQQILDYAEKNKDRKVIIVGDFNTCLSFDYSKNDPSTLPCTLSEKIKELKELGWVDAWREIHPNDREYSWGNGNFECRYDYAFIANKMKKRLKNAAFNHDVRKIEKLSDHSLLIVELEDDLI